MSRALLNYLIDVSARLKFKRTAKDMLDFLTRSNNGVVIATSGENDATRQVLMS